jgi:transposase
MGRSRGGLTTKIHALVDAEGLPIALKLTEGQAHDGKSAADMLEALADGQILEAEEFLLALRVAPISTSMHSALASIRACRWHPSAHT